MPISTAAVSAYDAALAAGIAPIGVDALGRIPFIGAPNSAWTSIAANTTQEQVFTITGAVVGNQVVVSPTAAVGTGLVWTAWVSAANTVTVRISNVTVGAVTPAAVIWRIDVL